MAFNVAYTNNGKPTLYLGCDVSTREEAQRHCDLFNAKYPGKPYPNGKGFYPFSKAWVIELTRDPDPLYEELTRLWLESERAHATAN